MGTPPNLGLGSYMDEDEFEMDIQSQQSSGTTTEEGNNSQATASSGTDATAASIEAEAVEQLKNPSKVLLLTVCIMNNYNNLNVAVQVKGLRI